MSDYELKCGDALAVLKTMESESVQCCVTSPPYWNLRDYGMEGQIGLEATPAEYVARLVDVFSEVRRVLKADGVCWVNLADSYAGAGYSNHDKSEGFNGAQRDDGGKQKHSYGTGLPPKNRMGIPHRVVFALQDDGWIWRDEIVWQKPAPMPESVTDRTTKAHEFIFMLTKNANYFYDNEAIAEPVTGNSSTGAKKPSTLVGYGAESQKGGKLTSKLGMGWEKSTRNCRSVWTVGYQLYSGAHFAVFPKKLIEPCILAGSRIGDTVLDPFNGSGTTGAVALEHGRNYIGIELNPAYIELAHDRINGTQPRLSFEQVSP